MQLNWNHYIPPDGLQEYLPWKISFRGFERNLFNKMMNRFENRWFIAIIGEVYRLVWNETNHLYYSAAEQISLY